jgi:hypothetical protein
VAEQFEPGFEVLLRGALKTEAASLPVSIRPADVLRRRQLRRRARLTGRSRLLLVAALIALPIGAILIGAPRPDSLPDGYSAVLLRSSDDPVQIFATRDGVAERVLAVPRSRLADAGILDASSAQVLETSATGWIALYISTDDVQASGYREFTVLLNLHDPDAKPIVRQGTGLGTWTPDGLYWSATNDAYELIDPATGQVTSLPRGAARGLDWWIEGNGRMRVAEDGHGLLVGGPQQWGVLSSKGTLSPELPDLAEGVGPRMVSSQWGALELRSDGAVSGPASDGTYRTWGDAPPLHHFLAGASWAVDSGVWLLIDRRSEGRTMLLIHRDQDGVDREVAAFPVDIDVQVSIGDLAPDDSLIAFDLVDQALERQAVIVDTRSGSSRLFGGAVGGFVPTAHAVGWLAGERMTETGRELSSLSPAGRPGPGYGPLPSLERHIASLESDQILLVHEVEATSSDPGPTTQLALGPVVIDEGIGLSLVCSGPGEITVTEIGADGSETPYTYGCLDPGSYHGHAGPNVRWGSASVQVEYDRSTTWRLVIYDPPPSMRGATAEPSQ